MASQKEILRIQTTAIEVQKTFHLEGVLMIF